MRRPNLIGVYLKSRYSVCPGLLAHYHGVLGQVGVGVLRTRLNPDHAFENGSGAVPQNSARENVPGCMRRFVSQVRDYVKPLLACAKNHLNILSRCSLSTENTVQLIRESRPDIDRLLTREWTSSSKFWTLAKFTSALSPR